MQSQLENYIQTDVNGSLLNKNILIWDSWISTVGQINVFLNEQYDKIKVLRKWSYEIWRCCQTGDSSSIFADGTKIQMDHCILDTGSVKSGWISTKTSEKYCARSEVVNGTNPGSRITVCRKENIWGL